MEATTGSSLPWRPVVGLAVCVLFGWFAFVRGVNVPLLSLVDLGFHELGHLVTYPFPDLVTASMGSITQIAVPFGLAVYFAAVRKDVLGFSFCLAWAATSTQNVSVYVADAPFQALPLIGGEHDWAFILGRLSRIDDATAIAGMVEGARIGAAGIRGRDVRPRTLERVHESPKGARSGLNCLVYVCESPAL